MVGGVLVAAHPHLAAQGPPALDDVAGCSLADVVKVTVFLTDMSLWPKLNEVYREYFPKDPPARSALGVNGLALPELLVELECVAELEPRT